MGRKICLSRRIYIVANHDRVTGCNRPSLPTNSWGGKVPARHFPGQFKDAHVHKLGSSWNCFDYVSDFRNNYHLFTVWFKRLYTLNRDIVDNLQLIKVLSHCPHWCQSLLTKGGSLRFDLSQILSQLNCSDWWLNQNVDLNIFFIFNPDMF